jgi:hypothetical protein
MFFTGIKIEIDRIQPVVAIINDGCANKPPIDPELQLATVYDCIEKKIPVISSGRITFAGIPDLKKILAEIDVFLRNPEWQQFGFNVPVLLYRSFLITVGTKFINMQSNRNTGRTFRATHTVQRITIPPMASCQKQLHQSLV